MKIASLKQIKKVASSKFFVLGLALVILFSAGMYYRSWANPPQISDAQVLTRLKTIILLPDAVAPSMAVVTDAGVLKKQQPEFFANVKNGDRLIIYPDLAIIYDYQANKIVKVGPVQGVPAPQPGAAPSNSPKP